MFQLASKVDKQKLELKFKKRIAEIEKEEQIIYNELFNRYLTNYQRPSDMYKKLCKIEGEKNED